MWLWPSLSTEVFVEVLGHAEAIHLLVPEDIGHLLIWSEQPTIVRILQLVLLNIGPQPLNNLGTRCFPLSNYGGQSIINI